jgi:dipeptidase D
MSDTNAFAGLEPRGLWTHFEAITRIPRPSGQEGRIAEYISNWAAARGFKVLRDKIGNVCVHVPGRPPFEKAAPVVLQSHLDMVCERNSDCPYDTAEGRMNVVRDGDWLHAEGTTLGADNGIGCAAMLYVAELKDQPCPPLDLLFTLDEERGLTGVKNLDPAIVRGRVLLNLDSEDDNTLTVGCSGGWGTNILWSDRREPAPTGCTTVELIVAGLKGGHSGLDIDKNRLNAVRAVVRILQATLKKVPLRLVKLDGGDKSNAIPRECRATVCYPSSADAAFRQAVEHTRETLAAQYRGLDDGLKIDVSPAASASAQAPFTPEGTQRALDLLSCIPSGVVTMSQDIAGLVETSSNLSSVHTNGDELKIVCSSRSSVPEALGEVVASLHALARLTGAAAQGNEGYPGWKPNMSSRALAVTGQTYQRLFGREVIVTAIHAGLECGLIDERIPGMDMVSLGPHIKGVHAPGERVQISSVERFAKLLTAVLADLARP